MSQSVYFTYRERLSPVLESQVLLPASLQPSKAKPIWIAMLPIGQLYRKHERAKVQVWKEKCRSLGIDVHFLPTGPSRFRTEAWDRWILKRALHRIHRLGQYMELCCRGAAATSIVISMKSRLPQVTSITFDCRGDEVAEIMAARGCSLDQKGSWTAEDRQEFERSSRREALACQADRIWVVSQKLRELLCNRHAVDLQKFSVRPCVVDLRRFPVPDKSTYRRALGLPDRFLVCYLGSLEWYQQPEKCMQVFREIRNFRPNAMFLGVTTHAEKMEKHLAEAGIEQNDFRVVMAEHDQIHQYVGAADLGLLLREKHPVNQVASPVKFAEMMACGLPVLISDHIGDASQWVHDQELGWVLSPDADTAEIRASLDQFLNWERDWADMARRCRRLAESYLSWQAYFAEVA